MSNERREYEMSQHDLDVLMDACKPVRYMVFGGIMPSTPQENANAAWAALGRKYGFDAMTVEPCQKGERFFTAIPVAVIQDEKENHGTGPGDDESDQIG